MKIASILCAIGALACVTLGLRLGWPDDAQQQYYRAHNDVERIAFRQDGTAELRNAVTHERAAEKNLYVTRGLGKSMIWTSAGFSGATILFFVFGRKRK